MGQRPVRGSLPGQFCAACCRVSAASPRYLHLKRDMHRDIKPAEHRDIKPAEHHDGRRRAQARRLWRQPLGGDVHPVVAERATLLRSSVVASRR